jgi:hypothetical protein
LGAITIILDFWVSWVKKNRQWVIRDVICALLITLIALMIFPRLGQPISTEVLYQTSGPMYLIAGGNVLFDNNMEQLTQAKGWEYPFIRLKETLRPPCFFTFNFEVPFLSEIRALEDVYSPTFALKKVESFLKTAGVHLVNLANDRNYGIAPAKEIIKMMRRLKIKRVGAGKNRCIAYHPAFTKQGPLHLAFIGLNTVSPESGLEKPSPHQMKIARFNRYTLKRIERAKKFADYLLVHIHWGDETTGQPTAEQIKQAHQLIDAGADIVIGHHSQVLQPIEKYKGGIIAYNLGDLAAIREDETPVHGALLCLTLCRGKSLTWKALPLTLNHGQPSVTPAGKEAEQVMEQLKWR